MGPLKLGRAEQVESCMNTREQEEPGGRLGLSLAQMEGYKGLPSRYDVTGYPFRLYLRPSGQVQIATKPQRHSTLYCGTIPTLEGAKEGGEQSWEG